jgi:hypothetical protein
MTEPGTADRATIEALQGASEEPTVPPEAAAVLAAAGVSALTTKLVNRWTLAGTATLVALGVAAALVRRRRGPLTTGS